MTHRKISKDPSDHGGHVQDDLYAKQLTRGGSRASRKPKVPNGTSSPVNDRQWPRAQMSLRLGIDETSIPSGTRGPKKRRKPISANDQTGVHYPPTIDWGATVLIETSEVDFGNPDEDGDPQVTWGSQSVEIMSCAYPLAVYPEDGRYRPYLPRKSIGLHDRAAKPGAKTRAIVIDHVAMGLARSDVEAMLLAGSIVTSPADLRTAVHRLADAHLNRIVNDASQKSQTNQISAIFGPRLTPRTISNYLKQHERKWQVRSKS